MSDGLNIELWTLPNSGNFVRVADITQWIVAEELDVRFNGISAGSLTVADSCPYDLLTVDPDNHANDVGRSLMIYRNGVWLAGFVIVEEEETATSEIPVTSYYVEGILDYYLDRARILAFDNPADPIREGDWIYGQPTQLPDAGEQISNDRTEINRQSNVTSGTFTLGDGTDETAAIDAFATAETVRTRLINDITAITDVAVSGDGSVDYPWAIELVDPSGTPITITVITNSTDGDFTVSAIREGGDLSPLPWHGSVDATTNLRVGVYDEFALVEAGVSGAPTAPAGSTSTYLLKLDPGIPRASGDYAGGQIEPGVVPGVRYRASIKVRSPVSSQRVRFVLRDLEENTLAWIETTVADSWVTLTAVDVDGTDFVEFPEGLSEIVYRVGVIETDDPDPIYIDVNEAILAQGDVAKPVGEITNELLAPITARGVLDWIVPTWTNTLDSAGAAWDRNLSVGIRHGQSLLQWIEFARENYGYETTVSFNGSTTTPFDLGLFNPNGAGTNRVGTGISVHELDGLVDEAARIRRAPDATYAVAEGDGGQWGEAVDSVLATGWGRLESYVANRQGRSDLATIAAQILTDSARDTNGRRFRYRNPSTLPLDEIELADVVTVVPIGETKRAERLVGVTISQGSDPAPTYDLHFDSLVLDPDAAEADAVRTLIRRFDALDELGAAAGARSLDVAATAASSLPTGTTIPWLVAASGAAQEWKDIAGATCDGTDDEVEIQAALDTYGLCELSPGSFNISPADGGVGITMPAGSILRGAGRYETSLQDGLASQPVSLTTLVEVGNECIVQDLSGFAFWNNFDVFKVPSFWATLSRVAGECWDTSRVVYAVAPTELWIDQCQFDARQGTAGTYAVFVGGAATRVWITRSEITGGENALRFDLDGQAGPTNYAFIVDNFIGVCDQSGLAIDGATDTVLARSVVARNHFDGHGQAAVAADRAAGIYVIGEALKDISASNGFSPGLRIADNYFEGDFGVTWGILIEDIQGNQIVDNVFEACYVGVDLDNADENVVENNVLFWCGNQFDDKAMIEVTGDSNANQIVRNTLRNEQGNTATHPEYGIAIRAAGADANLVVANDLRNPGEAFNTAPILDSGTGTLLDWPADATYGDNFT